MGPNVYCVVTTIDILWGKQFNPLEIKAQFKPKSMSGSLCIWMPQESSRVMYA